MTESRSLMLGIEGGHRGVGRQELQEETSGGYNMFIILIAFCYFDHRYECWNIKLYMCSLLYSKIDSLKLLENGNYKKSSRGHYTGLYLSLILERRSGDLSSRPSSASHVLSNLVICTYILLVSIPTYEVKYQFYAL